MKQISKVLVFAMIFGFVFAACNNGKKEDGSANEVVNQKEQVKEDKSEEHDHGYEIAMATYQCPMKCEGEKTYEEEGSCPVCKMDLKEVEVATTEESKEEEKE